MEPHGKRDNYRNGPLVDSSGEENFQQRLQGILSRIETDRQREEQYRDGVIRKLLPLNYVEKQ